ncbi:uncharacterized protein LOC126577916 [Anopheles aquasalis]|uniref:uncharacterized protein LOC126577916 n=1 Tax=Anopheles aquasalis TaxID=42839 RepID=UPI00215A6666|nr:uncharacterized protein LOC126577916 [Anopheles aquasalis]XP_050095920.1 uncharacterized protein LOC126577916 [Anopheles aquasalis]
MSEEFDGRFNERLLELTQDAFCELGFELFDPTGRPTNCLQSLVTESMKPASKASKAPKQPTVPESSAETEDNLISQLNLNLEQAGDIQYRISNLLAIIECHEEKIAAVRPELTKNIEDERTPIGQRVTETKEKVYKKASAEQSLLQQENQRLLRQKINNPSRRRSSGSKAIESLIQQRDREFQLLSAFFKYIVSDLTTRRNVKRSELAADLRGIRQSLQLLLDQDQPPVASILEGQSTDNQQQSSIAHEQKFSSTMPITKQFPSEKAQGSGAREKGPSTSSSSSSSSASLLKIHPHCPQGGSMVKAEIKSEKDDSTEVIEIIDDDDED